MKFTLRDLFWLLLVTGLALGWWLTYRSRHKQLEDAVELLRLTNDEASLWQYRADTLAQQARKDGWKVNWSGTWNDHTTDIESPDEIKKSSKVE